MYIYIFASVTYLYSKNVAYIRPRVRNLTQSFISTLRLPGGGHLLHVGDPSFWITCIYATDGNRARGGQNKTFLDWLTTGRGPELRSRDWDNDANITDVRFWHGTRIIIIIIIIKHWQWHRRTYKLINTTQRQSRIERLREEHWQLP